MSCTLYINQPWLEHARVTSDSVDCTVHTERPVHTAYGTCTTRSRGHTRGIPYVIKNAHVCERRGRTGSPVWHSHAVLNGNVNHGGDSTAAAFLQSCLMDLVLAMMWVKMSMSFEVKACSQIKAPLRFAQFMWWCKTVYALSIDRGSKNCVFPRIATTVSEANT